MCTSDTLMGDNADSVSYNWTVTVCLTFPTQEWWAKPERWKRKRKAFLTPLCSAPWDREHEWGDVDRTGEREVGMLTAAISLPLTHIHTQMYIHKQSSSGDIHKGYRIAFHFYCVTLVWGQASGFSSKLDFKSRCPVNTITLTSGL